MAVKPLLTDVDGTSGGIAASVLVAGSYAQLLHNSLPELLSHCMNKILEEHVTESRDELDNDADYQRLSQYYDVVQVEDEPGELVFAFFDLPPSLHDKAEVLEQGDATHSARAFIRTTLFSGSDDGPLENVGTCINSALGNVVVSDA